MKHYTSLEQVRRDWLTTRELYQFLDHYGFPHTPHTIRRWERVGIIPKAKTIMYRGKAWRVFDKDGNDFENILKKLQSLPKRVSLT